MIDAVPAPFAVNKTIRQRQTCFWGELRLTTMASSRRSSEAVTVMDIPVRMRQIRTNNQNGESQIGLARQARSNRCFDQPLACHFAANSHVSRHGAVYQVKIAANRTHSDFKLRGLALAVDIRPRHAADA
jgi:hypothetical protein